MFGTFCWRRLELVQGACTAFCGRVGGRDGGGVGGSKGAGRQNRHEILRALCLYLMLTRVFKGIPVFLLSFFRGNSRNYAVYFAEFSFTELKKILNCDKAGLSC